jgi:hypothetical protein
MLITQYTALLLQTSRESSNRERLKSCDHDEEDDEIASCVSG